MAQRVTSRTRARVNVFTGGGLRPRPDQLATEEPLEIRLLAGDAQTTLAVTMRTPGADFELGAGFLYGEGIVSHRDDIASISYCTDPTIDPEQLYNVVNVRLASPTLPDLRSLERHFYTSSACGVCGKASLDALELRGCAPIASDVVVDAATLCSLPDALRTAQGIFDQTGGLHAAGLFTAGGESIVVREDVGRHNAVDKVVGWALLEAKLPLADRILMVSGRASYEIMQKALAAGIPIVCAVSAPSSLAVSVAQRFDMTLVGFLRNGRFNVYAGDRRLSAAP